MAVNCLHRETFAVAAASSSSSRRRMACNDVQVTVVSRRLVRASDSTVEPHVLSLSNLDFLPQPIQVSMICIYPTTTGGGGGFNTTVAAFESGLPSLLNHFFLLAGRIATDPSSGLPEAVHCNNQGAELVVGKAGVPLASLLRDHGDTIIASLRDKVQLPYGRDLALSVQLVSFACGGSTVAWCTNHAVVDGSALSLLVSAWSELARTGTLAEGSPFRPDHDRSAAVFCPRVPPSYAASVHEGFARLDGPQHQINALTAAQSFVHRLYYIEASDIARLRREAAGATRVQAVSAYLWKALAGAVVSTSETRCRMGWWVNGRQRATPTAPNKLRAAPTRNYFGNAIACAVREASARDVLRMPLPEVAAMARETIAAVASDEHLQDLVDWVEAHHKIGGRRYTEAASVGLGGPAVMVTAFASFALDTDFGFGRAAVALPMSLCTARLCSGFVEMIAKPDGSWIVKAVLWPKLAAALESDEPRVFKPVTADCLLGLSVDPQAVVPRSRI